MYPLRKEHSGFLIQPYSPPHCPLYLGNAALRISVKTQWVMDNGTEVALRQDMASCGVHTMVTAHNRLHEGREA